MTKTEEMEARAWAIKVAASKPPRYTDASRNAARFILATLSPASHDSRLADELAAIDARLRAAPTQSECSEAVNDLLRFMDKSAPTILAALRSTPAPDALREALGSAIKRIETIQETHPEIALDSDLAYYRRAYGNDG